MPDDHAVTAQYADKTQAILAELFKRKKISTPELLLLQRMSKEGIAIPPSWLERYYGAQSESGKPEAPIDNMTRSRSTISWSASTTSANTCREFPAPRSWFRTPTRTPTCWCWPGSTVA